MYGQPTKNKAESKQPGWRKPRSSLLFEAYACVGVHFAAEIASSKPFLRLARAASRSTSAGYAFDTPRSIYEQTPTVRNLMRAGPGTMSSIGPSASISDDDYKVLSLIS